MHDALTAAQAVVDMQRQMDATDSAVELRGLGHHLMYRKRDLSDVLWSLPEEDVRNWRPWARGASREVLAVLQVAGSLCRGPANAQVEACRQG